MDFDHPQGHRVGDDFRSAVGVKLDSDAFELLRDAAHRPEHMPSNFLPHAAFAQILEHALFGGRQVLGVFYDGDEVWHVGQFLVN